jgi:outer membrane receptor protein involved in Fe transport
VFSGTYAWNRDNNDRPDAANDYSVTPKVVNPDRRTLLSANWRWNPAPSLTNEVRGGFNRSTAIFDTTEKFGPYLLGGLLFGNPVNTFLREGRYANSYHAADNANWVHGRHGVQFGFQMHRITVDSFDRIGTLPLYTLGIGTGNTGLTSAQLPGISAADLTGANNLLANLAGYVTSYTQTFNVTSRTSGFVKGADNERNYSLNNYAFYGQDSWKIQPRLSLNLGLRYDYYSPVDERDALRLLPVIQNGDLIATMFSNSTLYFAGSAVGRPWYNKDLNNFAPNVGLAWDVSGAGKTVIRAAYSVSFVEDENIRALDNSTNTNTGLQSNSARTGLTGLLRTCFQSAPATERQLRAERLQRPGDARSQSAHALCAAMERRVSAAN